MGLNPSCSNIVISVSIKSVVAFRLVSRRW
ncbi:MAG: hypothetical protein H7320_19405 [Ferruginibacter sp.]|nr:hypothetical protein [Ferruginibacter sp.]